MDMIGYTEPGYEELSHILFEALNQAQSGKGRERHANNQPFIDQPIMIESRLLGLGFTAGQARKKILEAVRCADITPDRSIGDLLGAIIYTAATILSIRSQTRLIPHPPSLGINFLLSGTSLDNGDDPNIKDLLPTVNDEILADYRDVASLQEAIEQGMDIETVNERKNIAIEELERTFPPSPLFGFPSR